MKFFKVVFGCGNGEKFWRYYESTSVLSLVSYLSNYGHTVDFIVEIKRINRLPAYISPIKAVIN